MRYRMLIINNDNTCVLLHRQLESGYSSKIEQGYVYALHRKTAANQQHLGRSYTWLGNAQYIQNYAYIYDLCSWKFQLKLTLF